MAAAALMVAVALPVAALVAAGGCGKGDGGGARTSVAAALDCDDVAARVQRCAADFWSAYAATERARASAAQGDVAGHVGEVRATFEAVGLAKLCENERQVHGDDPGWRAAIDVCERQSSCAAWAACAAPALFAAPRRVAPP